MTTRIGRRDTGRRRRRCAGAVALGLALAISLTATAATAQLLYTPDVSIDASGVFVTPRDVVTDAGSGSLAPMAIPDLPLTTRISAFHPTASGELLYALATTVELPGPLLVERRDVVRDGAGGPSLELDGGAAGVPDGVGIDALSQTGAAELLVSFDTAVELSGVLIEDEDLALWNGSTWSLFFDGSAEGVPVGLDLDGAHYLPGLDALRLTFDQPSTIAGIAFADEDLLGFDRSGGVWSLEFTGAARDPALERADLIAVPEPKTTALMTAGAFALAALGRMRSRPPGRR